ncbi:Cyclic di-GMP phosphodiesterase Gmr [Botrimarina colliarenosi]|uniref:Cyclic di-GMP phosphodiesterase Gmr n=1 Tax=Botrimarina colliarenosi TaxID=2528001 RepID=A0A5C5ZZC1_9BACT|nr:bifunctional diguanylate cyclase/phosphodiesterase [Botrimarina colliarenosi]TWT92475.1 Cyclic di-GMP phosphodiesterase Gmr [Botrimarina colliarenosi]
MPNPIEQADTVSRLHVESNNAGELRAQRVWRLVVVLWMTWLFFTCYLWSRSYETAAWVCFLDSALHLLILVGSWRSRNYQLIMNLNLAASAVGLFLVSISDPAMGSTMLFFPVSILVASQLLGVRDAFSWLIVNIVAFVSYMVVVHGFWETFTTSNVDELVLLLGVAACTFFCCHQGEAFYKERTLNLFNLSERLRKKGETLHKLATTDALTGLINRFQFQVRLKDALNAASPSGDRVALFLIDMDGFKEINDTLGHPIGDEALIEIASRLRNEFGDYADVARLGGDEFCIIYPRVLGEDQSEKIAEHICSFLTHRYVLEDAEFPMGASVGYAIFPDHTRSDHEMLSFADTAMFHAKAKRLGHACYRSEMTDRLVEYRSTQERLSGALERGEFFIVYQPKVDLQTGVIRDVEALLRWRYNGEVIPPYRFISLLEQSREIIPVSNWIATQACRQIAEWELQGYKVGVSINVSAVQFKDDEFCDMIAAAINEVGIDPRSLECEITEGLLIDNVSEAVDKLVQIKEMGVRISIDDFGTGYSSLAYLRQFPIDTLKIDRAFIKDIPHADDGTIASSIIVLSKALGLNVIAEGVETDEQIEFLKHHDCDEYQGYYMSPPVSPEEISVLLERHNSGAPRESVDDEVFVGGSN